MLRKKWLFAGLLSITLAFALVFSSCLERVDDEEEEQAGPPAVAKPYITAQTGTKRYIASAAATAPLSVTAAAADITAPGDLEYQWYKSESFGTTGGELLENETGTTYTAAIPTTAGTTYYYVEITNPAREGFLPSATTSNPIGIIVLSSLPTVSTTVTVTETQQQYVRGFGGMSNAFGYNDNGRFMEMRDIETMFGPGGLGYKILRIMLWPDAFSAIISGQVEPQMNNQTTYLQAVKKVNEYGGYVLASPWTAPAYMKTNESTLDGGSLKDNMFQAYAAHLRTFINNMEKQGAPVYVVSVQNEPSVNVTYAGMEWSVAQHTKFLNENANVISRYPTAIKGWGGGKEQPYVKVMTGERHNPDSWYTQALSAILNQTNSAALANTDIVAYHLYGSRGNYNTITANGALTKETWMTEYNINSGNQTGYYQDSTWNYVWTFVDCINSTIGVNNSSSFVWWYLKRFYGCVGDGAYGTINGAVMPRGYALSHFAKYATDTVRVNATTTHSGGGDVKVMAFQRKKSKSTDKEQEVMADEDSYSIVIYDQRTEATGETLMRVNLPAGFTATNVTGIISDPARRHAPVDVILNPDGNSADFTLPVNAIVSLKFVN